MECLNTLFNTQPKTFDDAKNRAKSLFNSGRFQESVEMYSAALQMSKSSSERLSVKINIALLYKKMSNYSECLNQAQSVIDEEDENPKAWYYLAIGLAGHKKNMLKDIVKEYLTDYSKFIQKDSIKEFFHIFEDFKKVSAKFEKAINLSTRMNLKNQIQMIQSTKRVFNLFKQIFDKYIKSFKYSTLINQVKNLDLITGIFDGLFRVVNKGNFQIVEPIFHSSYLDVPTQYLCPISTIVISDPVVSPEGISYEKENILNWLKENKTEPTTKKQLEPRLLQPNLNLKTDIEHYRHENPWIDFEPEQVNLDQLEF